MRPFKGRPGAEKIYSGEKRQKINSCDSSHE